MRCGTLDVEPVSGSGNQLADRFAPVTSLEPLQCC
jgi:hypothetical protein